jgi:hypothetical protein
VDAAEAEYLRAGIDRVMEAREAFVAGSPVEALDGWYAEAPLDTDILDGRGWNGDLWAADSPHMMCELLELYGRLGLTGIISDYLRENIALSVGKTTLRRVEPVGNHDWHQDGAFLGGDVRTINVWLSLSDCGVGPEFLAELEQQGTKIVHPVFRPGDMMIFDHVMLHRTYSRPHMTKRRWAIEAWFFAISTFPWKQVPILV